MTSAEVFAAITNGRSVLRAFELDVHSAWHNGNDQGRAVEESEIEAASEARVCGDLEVRLVGDAIVAVTRDPWRRIGCGLAVDVSDEAWRLAARLCG